MSVELKAALNDVEFKRAVLRSCLATTGHGDHKCFVTDIHPHDQMLQHSLQEHADAHAAISQYFSVGAQQFNTFSQIAGLLFQDRERVKVLDFACGFGRLTRFLVLERSRFRITGAEIQQEALDFVAKRFAVQCLNSCPDPSAFNCNDSFDIIWVASLFSHLPEGLFSPVAARPVLLVAAGWGAGFQYKTAGHGRDREGAFGAGFRLYDRE